MNEQPACKKYFHAFAGMWSLIVKLLRCCNMTTRQKIVAALSLNLSLPNIIEKSIKMKIL